MTLVRELLRNCSRFLLILLGFFLFANFAFAGTETFYPTEFLDCATEGASCDPVADLKDYDSLIGEDGGTEYGSDIWPDDAFAFSGINWNDNSNPHFIQFNFGDPISGDVVAANIEYDGIFSPVGCSGECRFKFLSSTDGFTSAVETYSQEDLSLIPTLNFPIPSPQLSSLNSLSLKLLAYGTPSDTLYSGFNSQIDYIKLTATVDEDTPSIPVLQSPIGGVFINDNTPLMQWEDSTDDESGIKNYLYRVYYNCSNPGDLPASCSNFYPPD